MSPTLRRLVDLLVGLTLGAIACAGLVLALMNDWARRMAEPGERTR